MALPNLILLGALAVSAMMAALWLVQRRTRDAGIVDVGWAAGLGVLALLYAALVDGDPLRRALVAVLAAAWSFRLAGYLLVDRIVGKPEDGRYQTLRAKWGARAQARLFVFFQIQALVDVVLAVPFLVAMRKPGTPFDALDVAGVAVWVVAVVGESAADRQLARFRADPANRGRTCRAGLWRFSRHPNYFFEWVHWWAYVVLALGAPFWWLTLVAPALMLYFLLRVTGIPPTEAQALRTRGDAYRRYQETTNAFFPWFPRGERAG